MAITVRAGKNGMIYVSGAVLEGANAWSVSIEHDAITYSKFGDTWENNLSGIHRWSGSMSAWHDEATKQLQTAAAADVAVACLIYPNRSDLTTFYNGSGIFSASSEASMDAPVSLSADITGDGTLALTGFS